MRFTFAILLFAVTTMPAAEDWKTWFKQGNEAFRQGRYQEAASAFRTAADISPQEFLPHFWIGMSGYRQYLPGVPSPENLEAARTAEAGFTKALELHPNDLMVMGFLAQLSYSQANGKPSEDASRFDEAVSWYRRIVAADSLNQEAYCMLSEIAWSKSNPAFSDAHTQLIMAGKDGPITNTRVKAQLKTHLPDIEEGISNLEKALEIDPEYDQAMGYMNLLIRQRADASDTEEEYWRDMKAADEWAKAARAARQRNNEEPVRGASGKVMSFPTLQEPPPTTGAYISLRFVPSHMLVSAKRQEANLIHKVETVYPPAAQTARVQGIVRLRITIDKGGSVTSTKVISGDPLLIEAAQEAVGQWKYNPTLYEGTPVDQVLTTVDVRFSLEGAT